MKARAARGKGDDSRARSSGKEVMDAGVDQVHGGAQAATGSVPGGERVRRAWQRGQWKATGRGAGVEVTVVVEAWAGNRVLVSGQAKRWERCTAVVGSKGVEGEGRGAKRTSSCGGIGRDKEETG